MGGIENLNDLLDEPIKETSKSTKKTKTEDKKEVFNDENKLIIGLNDKGKELFIPEKSRFLNTLVLGTKGTGKTTSVLPMFVEQDLKRKKVGMTIISSSKEMSYNLYNLAKKYKRKIHFIKPSINNEVTNKFLWLQDYNYDYINENIINYKEAIKKKEVIIIDMELLKYKSDALKATAMLLLQLRLDIQETDITQRCHHFLYVDDAYNYLKFLEDLLTFSDNYNLGITLFMQSRNQLITKNKDFTSLINNNIRNTLLLNNITPEDYVYYKDKFFEKTSPNEFFNREFNTMLYETIDAMGVRRTGVTKFKKMLIGDWDELEAKSKKIRASLLKDKRKEREIELREKYQKSIETQKIVEETKIQEVEHSHSIETSTSQIQTKHTQVELTKEPKPLDSKLLESLTQIKQNDVNIQNIKPRDFNLKKEKEKHKHIQTSTKPNFNPPKTNYDLELENKSKPTILDVEDLGSIKPKQETTSISVKENNKSTKVDKIKDSNKTKEVNIDTNKPIETSKTKQETKTQENINPLEIQKQKELESIRIQEEIEKKIQEQIKNEENERKRLVATRIFNNYNENIDYCDEVFDFKYE